MDHAYQKLGELLLAGKHITSTQLEEALQLQASSDLRLGEVLVRNGFISEEAVANALASQYGYEVVDPVTISPTQEALELLSFGEAANQCLLPFRIDSDAIFCLVADPLNVPITDELARRHRKRVVLSVAADSKLKARILEAYRGDPISQTSSASLRIPERFARAIPRYESKGVLWIDAHDTFLDRPISLAMIVLGSSFDDVHLKNVKSCAKQVDGDLVVVHDSIIFEDSRLTVLERLPGLQLSETLRSGHVRSPADSAKTVSRVAKAASELALGDPTWICAENVWLDGHEAKIAPIFVAHSEYRCESEVEALGNLLWQCLIGREDCKFEANSAAVGTIPSGMLLILQRCLSLSDDRFKSPKEVCDALATFRWASEPRSMPFVNEIDRDELLATLRLVQNPVKPTFWKWLFGRNAA